MQIIVLAFSRDKLLGASSGKNSMQNYLQASYCWQWDSCHAYKLYEEITIAMGSRRYADAWWFVLACV